MCLRPTRSIQTSAHRPMLENLKCQGITTIRKQIATSLLRHFVCLLLPTCLVTVCFSTVWFLIVSQFLFTKRFRILLDGKDRTQDTMLNWNVIGRSMPFFSNLQKCSIGICSRKSYNAFLTNLSISASNLETLHLGINEIRGGWLKNLQNLRELWLLSCNIISWNDIIDCFRVNPNLKEFGSDGENDVIRNIGGILSKYCRGLKLFADLHKRNPYGSFGEDLTNRYKFFSAFPHLNTVTLTSYTTAAVTYITR